MATRIQLRRDSSTNWTSNNPTLAEGEIGIELDTNKFKIGDGLTAWNSLSYAASGGTTSGGTSGAPTDATYVTTTSSSTLTNERVLTQGSYITVTDNGSSTVTVAVDATNANTASKVVARDSSGNFSAGTVTAALSGNATTATTLQTSRNINGTAFNGSADITITAAAGSLTGTTLNSTVTASSLTSFGSSPTINTPALTLSTTTSTTEGRIAWDATNDQIEVGTGSGLAEFGPLGSTTGATLGVAAIGTATTSARSDHVHPTTGVILTTSPLIVATFSKMGTVTTGSGAFRWYNDTGSTLTIGTVRASVDTAPTGASLIVDVNVNGSTIYGTQTNRPTITSSGFTATGGTKSTTTIANSSYLTVDIDQVGSTVAGSDLTVLVWLSYV